MRRGWLVAIAVAGIGVLVAVMTRGMGLTATRSALPGEATLARWARAWTLPAEYRDVSNPVELTPDVLRAGLEHWADHCATCHANDGSGQVTIGRALFPPAPDMRLPATQDLGDGALFYAIEYGIPFTGMPAWSNGTDAGARSSWELVHFIRHLPRLTPDEIREMEALNPRSAADREQERMIQEFLGGGS